MRATSWSVFSRFNFEQAKTANAAATPGSHNDGRAKNLLQFTISRHHEAYSVAGEIGFGWWLVEHYLSYHVNCPDGCVSGEPTRGRKDPPGFEVGDRSFYYIPDSVDPFVESFLPLQ